MKYQNLLAFVLFLPFFIHAQKGITFKVETLTKPEKALLLSSQDDIHKRMILSDVHHMKYFDIPKAGAEIQKSKTEAPYHIVAANKEKDSLVDFGYHTFFDGMYKAYADHRPFVLSPDMIWLLISQGFAHHINNNAEEFRSLFVDFDGKVSLIVKNDKINLNDPNSPWEEVFPEFVQQIGKHTGKELINTLSADFTTTTPASRAASQVTIMEAMKTYFEFIVMRLSCGIPEVTLEGTPEDWEKVLHKTNQLRKYKLGWWVDEMEPVLSEIVKTSKGDIDTSFWRNMFKYHTLEKYGAPKIIDGWIVKFFPYNKDGKRNNLKEITGGEQLPIEIVKIDLKFVEVDHIGNFKETALELWSGFFGLHQDPKKFTLKPQIGWLIRKKVEDNKVVLEKLKSDNVSDFGGIMLRVKNFPDELLQLEHIKDLTIYFIDEIQIPDAISKLKVDRLRLEGKITKEGIERVRKLLPNTELIINRQSVKAQL